MNTRWLSVLLSLMVISVLLVGNPVVSAQEIIQPEFIPEEFYLPNYIPKITNSLDSIMGATVVGEPGTVFSYERTFGETEVAYLSDTFHINYPWGIGTDGDNLWIGELWGNRGLKYSNNGIFQMQIGLSGYADIYETVIMEITDVEVDSSGNIWVVDGSASHIVKFDPSGNKLLELGYGWGGGIDNDRFSLPQSIAFDSEDNIYVSDGAPWFDASIGNHRIQIFDKDGNYLTTIGETSVCGNKNDQLCGPRHIKIYENFLFISDSNNQRIQIFDITTPASPSYVHTLGTSGESGDDNTHFNYPSGVEVDFDYIYIADLWNNRVQIFNRNSYEYETSIGGVWGTSNNQFKGVSDVAVDTDGFLYVSDFVNTRVQQFAEIEGSWVYHRTFGITGEPYITDGYHYNHPSSVTIGADRSIFITEDLGHRLVKLNSEGELQWTIGATGVKGDWDSSNDRFNNPFDVALDSSGKIYVADQYHGRVQIYNPDSSYFATISDQIWCPVGLTIDANDNVYVADWCQNTVQIYNSNYELIEILGESGVSGSDNFHFSNPRDVAIDSSGKIYVSDANNLRVQIFNSNYSYINTIGENGVSGNDFSHFAGIEGLTIDKFDNLYVVDGGNDRLQIFDPSGAYLTTIGGSWGNNTGQIQAPGKPAVDTDGNIYIADWGNHRIQKFSPGYPNWEQININGFGVHPTNAVSALEIFDGKLYAGTWSQPLISQIWRLEDDKSWQKVSPAWAEGNTTVFDLVTFKNKLYAGTANENGGEIWRMSGDIWEQVVSGGFGDDTNYGVNVFFEFNDYLYVATSNGTGYAELWRSSTGDEGGWADVGTEIFTDGGISQDLIMEEYKNKTYIGFSKNGSAELWSSSDGSTWNQVNLSGIGTNIESVTSMAIFQDTLHIGFRNTTEGAEIWQTSDGINFTNVMSGGLGKVENARPYGLLVIRDALYLSITNLDHGAEVWKTNDGINWESIAEGGFGDSNTVWSTYMDKAIIEYNGNLIIGTMSTANGGKVWSYDTYKYIFLPLLMKNSSTETETPSWKLASSPTTKKLNDVYALSTDDVWVVGDEGTILHWNGSAWQTISSPTVLNIHSLSMKSANDGMAFLSDGTELVWNGSAWNIVNEISLPYLGNDNSNDLTNYWTVGGFMLGTPSGTDLSGTVYKWNNITKVGQSYSIPHIYLNTIDMVNSSYGWAAGDIIDGSSNYSIVRWDGSTWNTVNHPRADRIRDIKAYDADHAWAIGYNLSEPYYVPLYWNGTSWNSIGSPSSNSIYSIDTSSVNQAWGVGSGGLIAFSNGSAWVSVTSPTTNWLYGIDMISESDGWAVGDGGVILHYKTSTP